ncbi:MAG: MFS transporter [Chloroflexi bacterium]|nr:MAG: MFS transporter [Chloroflexota bacterium]
MQEPTRDELVNELPKNAYPTTATSPERVSAEAPAPTRRVGPVFIAAYAAAYFGTWMALLTPIIVALPLRIAQIDAKGEAGDLSLILGIGAIFALVANPLFGKLSDRTRSRLGMRRPWIVGGVITGIIGLLIIALAPAIPLILVGWCLAQMGFNALLAVEIAVLPDQVPEEQRGTVSGVLGMCQNVGIVAGVFLAQAVAGSTFLMFMLPATICLVLVLLFVFVLRDRRLARDQQLPPYGVSEFLRSFWVNPLRYPDFGWNWAGRFLIFMGLATLLSYQVFYLLNHLHENPSGVGTLVFYSTLVQTILIVISSNLGGWLSDKVHRRKIFVIIAAVIYAAGLAAVAFAGSFTLFLVAIAITGIGQGTYLAIDLALAAAVLPEGGKEAAKDLGVLNIANALPQSLAPAIAPIFLAIGGGNNYTSLFTAAAIFALLGALAIQPIKGVR